MARSTRKSLAGTAAAAAKKVIGRRGAAKPAAAESAAPTAAAKKTAPAAKKATPVKKAAPAKKATPVKKSAPVRKAAKATVAKKIAPEKTVTTAPIRKSTPARKAPISSLAVKEGEDAWTKADVKEVLTELHTQRENLVSLIDDAEHDLAGLMRDAGDGAGHDQADMGATSFERDHELTVVKNERDMVVQIDRALGRIHDGTYGVCESCGQPIGKMRLMAFPRATLCMSCKQREERR